MAAVKLAVMMENEYLGFDFAEEMVAEAKVGDIVSLSYDFGAGPRKIIGTFMGREERPSGEVFVWVEEKDAAHTRYAIPMGMVEGLRVEARADSLPTTSEVGPARVTHGRARAHRTLAGTTPAAFGRACARIDYDGGEVF